MDGHFKPLRVKVFERLEAEDGTIKFLECQKELFLKRVAKLDDTQMKLEDNCLETMESLFVTKNGIVTADNVDNKYYCLVSEIDIKKETDVNFEIDGDVSPNDDAISDSMRSESDDSEKNIAKNKGNKKKCNLEETTHEWDMRASSDTESYVDDNTMDIGDAVLKDSDIEIYKVAVCEMKKQKRKRRKRSVTKSQKNKMLVDFDTNFELCKCISCDRYFHSQDLLDQHLIDKHDSKTFPSDFWTERFDAQNLLETLQKESHPGISPNDSLPCTHICEHCKETFNSEELYSKHQCIQKDIEHLLSQRFKCHKCDSQPIFTTVENLRRHSKETHGTKRPTHKCEKCDQEFKSVGAVHSYIKHIDMHICEMATFQCGICDVAVKTHDELMTHFYEHTEVLPYNCKRCKKGFKSIIGITAHIKRDNCHSEGTYPVLCPVCGKGFKTDKQLQLHVDTDHTKSPRFQCEQCPKAFYRVAQLNFHVKIHDAKRDYVCDTCGKRFKFKPSLKKHKMTHQDERPYSCSVCGHTFKLQTNLISHQKRHTTERNYLCHICTNPFKTPACLRRHLHTHTSQRTHECDECGKKFLRPYNLQVHQRIHTGEKPYKCTECSRSFSQVTGLRSHNCARTSPPMSSSTRLMRLTKTTAKSTSTQLMRLPKTTAKSSTPQLMQPPIVFASPPTSVSSTQTWPEMKFQLFPIN